MAVLGLDPSAKSSSPAPVRWSRSRSSPAGITRPTLARLASISCWIARRSGTSLTRNVTVAERLRTISREIGVRD
jgi:hypothetical protein